MAEGLEGETRAERALSGPLPAGVEGDAPPLAAAGGGRLPWSMRKPVVVPPEDAAYGWLEGRELHASTREEILERAGTAQPLHMVWTPETPLLAWPEEVPEVFERMRAASVAEAKKALWLPAGAFVVLLGMALSPREGAGGPSMLPVLLGLAFLWAGARVFALRDAVRMTPGSFRARIEDAVAGAWVLERPFPWTKALAGCIGVVAVVQFFLPSDDVAAAALFKPLVWEGEAWRLFTASLMHGNFVHLFFNATALLALGRLTESHTHRAYLPLVFLLAALVGNVFSLVLMPGPRPSVGASGGLMGITGFLVILARRRRAVLPPGFLRAMVTDVVAVAALGVFGAALIDNAAHAGGFVAGLALGALLIPSAEAVPTVGWRPPAAVRAAGWVALVVLVLGAAATAGWIAMAPEVPAGAGRMAGVG